MKYLILSLLIVQSTYSLNAQKIEYKSYFIKENKTIGDTIYFISTINYPKNIEIIQPDSSNDYKTFEYIDKLIQDDKLSISVDKSKTFGFTKESLFFTSIFCIICLTANSTFLPLMV